MSISDCKIVILLLIFFVLIGCKKDEPQYVYQLEDVKISEVGAEKPNVKTSTEYISIAYSDAFGKAISSKLLAKLKTIYISFGDKEVVEDLIVKNFMNDAGVDIPTEQEMNNDLNAFVKKAYNQIYNREPSAYEQWFLSDFITTNHDVIPTIVYYALMTSNEYRQF